ncbi:MAG: hypothetical protein QOE95_2138 [Gaiellaceae bacterium]|nr:hypothetical protein [Gaiellaceae bacterium]
MNSPRCEYCEHINREGAEVCEACNFPLGGERTAGWAGPHGEEPGSSAGWSPADDIPSPPFKGAGDVISPMLAVYRKHFTLVGILVLVTTLPQALLQYGIMDAMGVAVRRGGVPVGMGQANLLLWVLTLAGGALLSGSLVYAVVDLQRVGQASAGECLARGLKVLPKVFIVTLLYSLIMGAGFFMLVVPGLIFLLMFAVCVPAAIVEGLGPIDALRRSHALTKGYKGLMFVTYFLCWLLVLVLTWVVIWSFARGGNIGLLPATILRTAVLGMLNSSLHVLTVYVYLGLLREHRSGFQANTFTT